LHCRQHWRHAGTKKEDLSLELPDGKQVEHLAYFDPSGGLGVQNLPRELPIWKVSVEETHESVIMPTHDEV
jgi:hypothetical protein